MKSKVDRIADLLADNSNDSGSEISERLIARGVDLNNHHEKANAIRQQLMARLSIAKVKSDMESGSSKTELLLEKIATWPKAKLLAWLESAQAGRFGSQAGETAIAYREQSSVEADEDELRALVEDVINAHGIELNEDREP